MNFIKKIFLLVLISVIIIPGQTKDQPLADLVASSDISGNWFLAYNYNQTTNFNKYGLKRGYFTIKTRLNDIFSARYTQDITLDQEGSDAGNVETRLKYLYIKTNIKHLPALPNSYFEFGLVHRPWLDFEGHINRYRVQGTMYAERHHIVNSADFGITYAGLIGGKISKEYKSQINDSFPGKYGSFAIGVYNGGGYHSIEVNNNKTIEGRLSLRPFSQSLPGLQLSYAFAYGNANLANNSSVFNMNLFFISFESEPCVLTAQYYSGIGDYEGNYVDYNLDSYTNQGYSLFSEILIPRTKFSLIGRYDYFQSDQLKDFTREIMIGGLAYKFLDNKVLFDYNREETSRTKTLENFEIVLEISF